MPKSIPIAACQRLARFYDLRQIILLAWDGERTHVVTYGKSVEDCDQAAEGGNELKKKWGWPPEKTAEPSRVKRLKARIAELEKQAEAGRIALLPPAAQRAAITEKWNEIKKSTEGGQS